MDDRSILFSRVRMLIQQLRQAEGTAKQVDPKLRDRVQGRLLGIFRECRDTLTLILEDLEGSQSAEDLKGLWSAFNNCRQVSDSLFRECLALIQGSLVRTSRMDSGLCDIADALLSDLSRRCNIPWDRFTILADKEFIPMQDMPEVIRLRFQEVGIWSLPVAAHEFGHFVGLNMSVGTGGRHYHPFVEFLDRECKGKDMPQTAFHLHEYFADLFATYTMGPSYACACVLLRFDPGSAYVDSETHPCSSKRVHWILRVLERMDEEQPDSPYYCGVAAHLRKSWELNVKLTRKPENIELHFGADVVGQLEVWLDKLHMCARRSLEGVRCRAEDWLRAKRLAELLIEGIPSGLSQECTLVDVVNAAWWCRIQADIRDSSLQLVGERAMELCGLLKDGRYFA